METPIKHRLTGAIILVALIVVLVPEMLSGPRAPETAAPPPLSLPAAGAGTAAPLRSIDIDVADRPPGAVAPMASPLAAPAAGAAGDAAATSQPAATGAPASAPAPAPVPVPPVATPAMAPAVAAPQDAAAAGNYVVQVGSFAARATADALAATLRRQGFAASVSAVQAGGRTLHRVRVGPAGSREAAEALRLRVRNAGHAGSVVAGP